MMKVLDLLLISTSFAILACGIDSNIVDASRTNTLSPIYWNASNTIFTKSPTPVKFVHLGDRMDIICPVYNNKERNDGLFYFILYQVNEENFRSCNAAGAKRLLTCDSPDREKKYTFLFQVISPNPWGLIFAENKSYYFISTSDGTASGLDNKKGGVCTDLNLKLVISVNKSEENSKTDILNPRPPSRPRPTPPTSTRYINTHKHLSIERKDDWKNTGEGKSQDGRNEVVNSNGLVIGVVLGACAVLFIVLLSFLGYKVYRRRRHVKKYQSPSLPSRGQAPQAQVTLLPIGHHQTLHHGTVTSNHHHHHHLDMQDLRPPPPYNESILDHAGSTMEV